METLAHAPTDVTAAGGGAGLLPPRTQVQMAQVPLVHFPPFDGIFRHQGMTSNCASLKSDAGLKLLHPRPAPPTVLPPQGPHAFSEGVRVLP